MLNLSIPAAKPTWGDLISKKSWPGFGEQSIASFIALHEDARTNNFASLLLQSPPLLVQNIRRASDGSNQQFVQEVLNKWHARQGTPVPFTWGDLIKCMKDADLDQHLVQIIEQNL